MRWTIWMPALLTSMSRQPKAPTTASTPSPTCRSSQQSMAPPPRVADIHGHAHRHASPADDLLGCRVRGLLLQVRDGHLGALAREKHRDVPANSAGGSGNNDRSVFEPHGVA